MAVPTCVHDEQYSGQPGDDRAAALRPPAPLTRLSCVVPGFFNNRTRLSSSRPGLAQPTPGYDQHGPLVRGPKLRSVPVRPSGDLLIRT